MDSNQESLLNKLDNEWINWYDSKRETIRPWNDSENRKLIDLIQQQMNEFSFYKIATIGIAGFSSIINRYSIICSWIPKMPLFPI